MPISAVQFWVLLCVVGRVTSDDLVLARVMKFARPHTRRVKASIQSGEMT